MREERPKREILTKEKCKIDLLESTKGKIGHWVIMITLAATIFAYLDFIVWYYGGRADKLPGWVCPAVTVLLSIGPIVMVIALIRQIRKNGKQRRMIRNGEFRIVEDRLEKSAQDVTCMKPDRGGKGTRFNGYRRDNGLRDLLVFADYGDFFILHYDYYKWSKLYSMSPTGVFNTSLVGDSFYLVIYDGDRTNEPVMVYNAKMFDLQEEEGQDTGN